MFDVVLWLLRQVIVQRVHVDGLCRTKDDLLTHEISGIFRAKNLIDVRRSHIEQPYPHGNGCWSRILLCRWCRSPTRPGSDSCVWGSSGKWKSSSTRHKVRTRFPTAWTWPLRSPSSEGWRAATTPWWETTREVWWVALFTTLLRLYLVLKFLKLSLTFQMLGVKLPNVFGRAEKVAFQFSYGTKETSYGLSFFKPQPGNFERRFKRRLSSVQVTWWVDGRPPVFFLPAWRSACTTWRASFPGVRSERRTEASRLNSP